MKNTCIFFLALIYFEKISIAQNEGEIVGKVIDSVLQEPLYLANISLEQNGNILNQTQAEDNGAFYFKPVKPGEYEIRISFVGYAPKLLTHVKVNSNDIAYVTAEINKSYIEIPPLIITDVSDKFIVTDPYFRIDAVEIKNASARSPVEVIAQQAPGVYNSDGGDKGGLFINGSRADATLYVIDGIKIIGSAYIPKNAIAGITVYSSGIPAKYGDVTGGVIEITTKGYAGIY